MQITKATTSHINFRKELDEIQIREQDYLIISNNKNGGEKKVLVKITSLSQDKQNELKGEAKILGEYVEGIYKLTPCRIPVSINAQAEIPPKGLISKIISFKGDDGIYLGDLITSPDNTDPYLLSRRFLERHVLCVASTGAGKSYSIGVLIEEILLHFKDASVILFDLHNEYWGLSQKNTNEEVTYLSMKDYSPRGFDEQILIFEKDSLGLGSQFDLPRLRRLLDLTSAQENVLSAILESPTDLAEIKNKIMNSDIHTATKDNLILKINSLQKEDIFTSSLDISALIKQGQISIIRLDQYIDEKRRNLVVNELLTRIFELKTQNIIESRHEIIVIIEEAHRYAHKSEILARIAREGRKFGLYEILVSQRPGDLPDNIIANMNTLIALRIKSEKDITKIRLMEGIENETVAVLPHLTKGEAMLVGLQDGLFSPVKVKIRPRLTKHIDPQVDRMPDSIKIYRKKPLVTTTVIPENIELVEEKYPTSEALESIKAFDKKDLMNLLSFEHIMIIHKLTGICIFQLSVSMLKIEPQLVSGFLTAITSLFTELKDGIVKDRTIIREFSEEIGDRSFTIINVEGEHSVTVLILKRPPKFKNRLKKRMREFAYVLEEKYQKDLANFIGELDSFQTSLGLLDKYLGVSLIGPLRLNTDLDLKLKESSVYQIISDHIEQLATSEGVYLEEMVNKCVRNTELNYIETINAFVELFQAGVLTLHDPTRNIPSIETKPIHTIYGVSTEIKPILTDIDMEAIEEEVDEELTKKRITEIMNLIHQSQKSDVPNQLKEDILKRDIQFESNIKVKNESIQTEEISEEVLHDKLRKIFEAGFIVDKKNNNPLNGWKITFSLANSQFIISIAKYEKNNYLIVSALTY